MKFTMSVGWRTTLLVLATACAGTPATPEQQRVAEQRLLAPFLVAREVGCGELLVELTGNFYAHVGQPATDQARHTVAREPGDGFVDTVWTNASGAVDAAFVVTIGEPQQITDTGMVTGPRTKFRVVNQVRLRIFGRRELTLNAKAGGALVLVREASASPREVKQFAIVEGVLQGS